MKTDRLYTVLQTPYDFMTFWGYDIYVEDKRSSLTPSTKLGKIIGIQLDKVQLRIGNVITDWFPLNHSRVSFFIDPVAMNGDKEFKKQFRRFLKAQSSLKNMRLVPGGDSIKTGESLKPYT